MNITICIYIEIAKLGRKQRGSISVEKSGKRRRDRQILSKLFTLKQMLEFLCQTIDRRYQVAHHVFLPSG